VIESIEEYFELNSLKDLIKEDYKAIFEEMESVNRIKEILNGINIKKIIRKDGKQERNEKLVE
jgi:prephenate dehydrogenase